METIYPRPSRSGPLALVCTPRTGIESASPEDWNSLHWCCCALACVWAIPRTVYEATFFYTGMFLTTSDEMVTTMITNSIFYLYFRTPARFCHALMPPSSIVVIYHCPRARSFSMLATAILSFETINTTLRKVTEFIILSATWFLCVLLPNFLTLLK